MTKRTTYLASIGFLALAALSAPSARAAYLVTFEEVGSDVVEVGGGTIDLTDLEVFDFRQAVFTESSQTEPSSALERARSRLSVAI